MVVGQNTLYAFDAVTLAYRGHNRFGRSVGTSFERRGEEPGRRPAPQAVLEGDTIWILAEEKVLRLDLIELLVKATGDLPDLPGNDFSEERLKRLDRNGNGVVELSEFSGPMDAFKRADRNRDRVLDRTELGSLSPLPGESFPREKRSLHLFGDHLVAVVGGTAVKFERKKLKVAGVWRGK